MDSPSSYDLHALHEVHLWQERMLARPGVWNQAARGLQGRVNRLIPEKVHVAVTTVIRQMVRGVLTGSGYVVAPPLPEGTLEQREKLIAVKIDRHARTAAAEGGITGAGGFFLGLADFPLLIGIKLKLLFDIAALYGYSSEEYRERVYLLLIFQLAFSSDERRLDVYDRVANWSEYSSQLPASLDDFDWRTFQQEYRDYIDLAKLAQMLPLIGAPVGILVNNRLVRKLGETAMNAYRMRWFDLGSRFSAGCAQNARDRGPEAGGGG